MSINNLFLNNIIVSNSKSENTPLTEKIWTTISFIDKNGDTKTISFFCIKTFNESDSLIIRNNINDNNTVFFDSRGNLKVIKNNITLLTFKNPLSEKYVTSFATVDNNGIDIDSCINKPEYRPFNINKMLSKNRKFILYYDTSTRKYKILFNPLHFSVLNKYYSNTELFDYFSRNDSEDPRGSLLGVTTFNNFEPINTELLLKNYCDFMTDSTNNKYIDQSCPCIRSAIECKQNSIGGLNKVKYTMETDGAIANEANLVNIDTKASLCLAPGCQNVPTGSFISSFKKLGNTNCQDRNLINTFCSIALNIGTGSTVGTANLTNTCTSTNNNPGTGQPSTNPPSTNPPSTNPPSTEPPSTEPPSAKPPSTGPPSTGPPSSGTDTNDNSFISMLLTFYNSNYFYPVIIGLVFIIFIIFYFLFIK